MTETILVSDDHDVRATLDPTRGDGINGVNEANSTDDAMAGHDAVIIACPPHPQQQSHRGDARLVAVSDALTARGVNCLRLDYSAWGEGYDERANTLRTIGWAAEHYDHMDLFGFSFGGAVALLATAEGADMGAISALDPTGRLADDLDTVAAFNHIPVPVQVVYSTRDDIAGWKPVVEHVQGYHQPVVEFMADHFFVGQGDKVVAAIAGFLVSNLGVE